VVSFREAHAWVEAWIPNLGWVRKDPTAVVAPQRIGMTTENIIGSQLGEGLFDKISKKALQGDFLGVFAETVFFIDSINSKWNYYLISYDLDFQRGLLERWSFKHPVWKVALLVFSSAFFLILAILGLAYWRLRPRVDPVLRSYAKMQKILAKKGVRKTLGEGPLDFARRARTALPEEGEAIDQAVLLFIDLRYGRKKLESSKLAELEENIKKIA
jgi:hypothetical protein